MKRICVWIFVSPFFISCSNNADDNSDSESATNNTAYRRPDDYPGNSANQYDMAGQLFNELLESYYQTYPEGVDKSRVLLEIESMAYANEDFKSLSDNNNYIPVNADRVAFIANGREAIMHNVIFNSQLTSEAKVSLYGFACTALIYQSLGPDYDAMFKFMIDYEAKVSANETFTAEDKRIILTTASIMRHSTGRKRPKKNTDRDWELLVGNIVAGSEGGSDNIQNAVIMAVSTAAYQE